MKKFTIAAAMVALIGGLLTASNATGAVLRVPHSAWPVCATADQDFCVESVSVSLNAGAPIKLTWVASGTATPVTPVEVPAAPAATDTKTAAPAAPVIPTPKATTEVSARAGITGRWTSEDWAAKGLAVYGYDGLFINAKTANDMVNWVMIEVLPVKVDPTSNVTAMAGQVGAPIYQAPLDKDIYVSVKARVGAFKNGVSVSVANDVSVDATVDAARNTLLIEGGPVSSSLQASTKQCDGETGKASANTVQMLVVIVPSNDDTSGFGIDGVSGDMSVASNGACTLGTPVWVEAEKKLTWTVKAPHFAADGVTENVGFYLSLIHI